MKKYHEDWEGNILEDDYGPIPSYQCICAAHCEHECGCGGWDVDIDAWEELYGDDSEGRTLPEV